MLFSEIYGGYFQVVAAILTEAAQGCLTDRRMTELVQEKAFAESTLSIPAALKSGAWPLLDETGHSVLHHLPTMPLTTLEKRWLKSLLLHPCIALFQPDTRGLEDVAPLCSPDTFVLFDQYSDGDPYQDETYIACFRTILLAIRQKRCLCIRFRSRTGASHSTVCFPHHLEYSAKDDKFRLYAVQRHRTQILNLGRICTCQLLEPCDPKDFPLSQPRKKELVFLLLDERNALERVLLHFSHFEKETRRVDPQHYQITVRYHQEDETELLIRVLSFGPMLKVVSPASFTELLKDRLRRQSAFPPPDDASP